MTLSNYSVAAVKTFNGREGRGYSCNLMLNGKKVAEVLDDANGGPLSVRWLDNEFSEGQVRQWDDSIKTIRMTKQEAAFEALVMALPKRACKYSESGFRFDSSDIVIEDLVNDQADLKKMKTMLKSKILFTKGVEIYQSKIIDIDRQLPALRAKHPTAKFLNTLPEQEAFNLFKLAINA